MKWLSIDSVRGGVSWNLSRVRRGIRWRWMHLRGLTGEFEGVDDSERCRELTELWERTWPDCEPIGYLLRGRYPERWVRFHSLPGSKRDAEDPAEYREIIHRDRTILTELLAGSDIDSLTVVAEDWDRRDLATGTSRRQLPEAWPWRIVSDDLDAAAGRTYCWVQQGLAESALDALLMSVADDRGRFLLAEQQLAWLFCPYDGGVDVLLSSMEERDGLRDRHAAWLPSRDDGM